MATLDRPAPGNPGSHPPPRQRISAARVAREVGVSAATVSYVLNNRPGVSEATRQRVIQAASDLGFEVPQEALFHTRTHIIGLILSDVANPFYPELSVGFSQAARRRGYELFLAHTDDDAASLSRAIAAMMDRDVDGIAIAVARSDNAVAVRELNSARVPFLQVSRSFPLVDAPFVGINDRQAAAEMMHHALTHERWPLGVVIGPRISSASASRERGFVDAAKAAGISIPGSYRVSVPLTLDGGLAAAEYLFSRPTPPKFVLCGSDILAFGIMQYAISRGFRIPEDVAVSGFDGISLARTPMIDLTGIVQPRMRMSSVAVDLLVDTIEHQSTGGHKTVCVPHSIRIGRTCGCDPREA